MEIAIYDLGLGFRVLGSLERWKLWSPCRASMFALGGAAIYDLRVHNCGGSGFRVAVA